MCLVNPSTANEHPMNIFINKYLTTLLKLNLSSIVVSVVILLTFKSNQMLERYLEKKIAAAIAAIKIIQGNSMTMTILDPNEINDQLDSVRLILDDTPIIQEDQSMWVNRHPNPEKS